MMLVSLQILQNFNPMYLAYREYAIPLICAVALHVIIIILLGSKWDFIDQNRSVVRPNTIQTSLITLQRKRQTPKKAAEPLARQTRQTRQNVRPAAVPEPSKLAARKSVSVPKVDPDLERRKLQEAIRNNRLTEMRQLAFDQAIEDESEHLIDRSSSNEAMGYVDGIYSLLVANWSRPPSARNGMSATIRVELFPNGELNTVSLIESSGYEVFDRSALAAVRKARKFKVPSDTSLFEKQFRSFTLLFKPEDLLR